MSIDFFQILLFLFESILALEAEPVSASRSGTYEVYKSNRRPVTDDETRKIESLAKAACTDDSIYVVMKPTHVYKRFFVVSNCLSIFTFEQIIT